MELFYFFNNLLAGNPLEVPPLFPFPRCASNSIPTLFFSQSHAALAVPFSRLRRSPPPWSCAYINRFQTNGFCYLFEPFHDPSRKHWFRQPCSSISTLKNKSFVFFTICTFKNIFLFFVRCKKLLCHAHWANFSAACCTPSYIPTKIKNLLR